jgi:predicted Fe-Mo cluster-binding NifX family protein
MRLCVTSQGDDLDSEVDPRFGRCAYFLIVDIENMEFEAVMNGGVGAAGGAGVQAAQAVAGLRAEAVATGNLGPNAFETLSAAGIRMFTGASGTVRRTVEAFKAGELKETIAGPTTGTHSGIRGGRGRM